MNQEYNILFTAKFPLFLKLAITFLGSKKHFFSRVQNDIFLSKQWVEPQQWINVEENYAAWKRIDLDVITSRNRV